MLSLPWAIPSLPVWGSSAQHLESSRMRQVTGLCVCLLIYSDSFMRTAGRVPAGQPRPPTCCHTGDSGSENTAALTAQQAVVLLTGTPTLFPVGAGLGKLEMSLKTPPNS